MPKQLLSNQEGLTLIELLAVSVLLAILSAILYSSISAVLNGREIVTSQKQAMLTAESIFSKLQSDFAAREAISLENANSSTPNPNPNPNVGFSGFGVRKFMMAENEKKQDSDFDSIRFVTHNLPVSVISEVKNFGLIEVGYRMEELDLDASRNPGATKSFRLLREEVPAAVQDKKTRKLHLNTLILSDSIVDFNLRFLTRGNWSDKWNSGLGRAFPEAIEVTLGLVDDRGDVHRFRTAFALSKQSGS